MNASSSPRASLDLHAAATLATRRQQLVAAPVVPAMPVPTTAADIALARASAKRRAGRARPAVVRFDGFGPLL